MSAGQTPQTAFSLGPSIAPWPRAVVIGTPETSLQAVRLLETVANAPPVLGCVLVSPHAAIAPPGVPLLGTLEDLPTIRRTLGASLAIVSLPSAMAETIASVRARLAELGMAERFVPPLQDLLTLRPPFAVGLGAAGSPTTGLAMGGRIDEQSLIGRPAREIDPALLERVVSQKRVLITGAGGSIGSELARLAARFQPSRLVLMDRSENALFEIDRRVSRWAPSVERRAVLHDVVDADETLRLLLDARPHVVLHAAAHKHVPLMEDHPALAVSNNLFGTKSIADAAIAAGVDRFVMISTDKAVNPSSVMGATKRLAEIYVQHLARAAHRLRGPDRPGSRASVVRFGNVLGSACSVLTIWAAQLAEGGPLTVTDPEMTRYFMTIPEAAALVMQSAALEDPGADPGAPVYVLDMGEPVRILDLARRFVRAHGFEPDIQAPFDPTDEHADPKGAGPSMPIRFTGARPGEKLHEELAHASESLEPTKLPGVRVWTGAPAEPAAVDAMITELDAARHGAERENITRTLTEHLRRLQPQAPEPEDLGAGTTRPRVDGTRPV